MKIIPRLTKEEQSLIDVIILLSRERGRTCVRNNSKNIPIFDKLVKKGIIIFIEETRRGYKHYRINKIN